MRTSLNPGLDRDFDDAVAYYETKAGQATVIKFTNEFRRLLRQVASRPHSFPIYAGDRRRANMSGFPYHVLFRIGIDAVRVLVLRHHKRHPSFGTRRR